MERSWLAANDTTIGVTTALEISISDVGHRAVALDSTRDPLRLDEIDISIYWLDDWEQITDRC